MKKLFPILSILFIAVLILTGCENTSDDPFVGFSYEKEQETIVTHTVRRKDIAVYETLFANTVPKEKIMQATGEISGYFKEYRVGLLDEVNEGDVVAVLDSGLLDNAIRDQSIRYEKARLKYEKAKLNYETTGLGEYDMLSSKLDFDYEEYKYNDLLEQRDALEVRAEISGTVTKMPADPGDYITGSTLLFEVTDDSEILIRYKSKESKGISLGDIIELEVRQSEDEFFAEVFEINGNEILMRPNDMHESFERTGSLVYIKLLIDMRKNALVVNEGSVIEEAGRTYVYMYDGTNLSERDIKAGITYSELTEVIFGLEEGEEVLTNPGR